MGVLPPLRKQTLRGKPQKGHNLGSGKIHQGAPGLKGYMDKEYFKREGTGLKEGAIIVLEMEGI